MDVANNSKVSKLVILYVFDKMEIPLTEETVLDMCCSQNSWVSYMLCKEVLADLVESEFLTIQNGKTNEKYYQITTSGRMCLNYFFVNIPSSLRDEISEYIKTNRINFRRKQEYFRDYSRNEDGSYTVLLKILDPTGTKLELKLNVANRQIAQDIYKKWEQKASQVYGALYDILLDE
ncbi:MAG: DUF4364 family protein [Clostridia bacterium]|nr:DUF4364 family protein [Clostridia bacterium]